MNTLKNALQLRARNLLCHEDWNIGVMPAPAEEIVKGVKTPPIAWWPDHSKKSFVADCFPFQYRESVYVFYELYDFSIWTGSLAYSKLDADGTPSPPEPVDIGETVHTSYPFVFEHDGTIYMIPETCRLHEAALYRAVSFPDRWIKVKRLLPDIPAIDASIVRFDDCWWIFASRWEHPAQHDLHIWYATSPGGDWTPHPANPVKNDVRNTRGGGAPFVVDGVLYRPAQSLERGYGSGIVINRVTKLTRSEFDEEPVREISPEYGDRYPIGLHTFSPHQDIVYVDGRRWIFSWSRFAASLRRKLIPPNVHNRVRSSLIARHDASEGDSKAGT